MPALQPFEPEFCIVTDTLYDCPVVMLPGTDWSTNAAAILGILGFRACAAVPLQKTAAMVSQTDNLTGFTAPKCSSKRATSYGNYRARAEAFP